MKDYYTILGIDRKASKDDIKKAFHKLAHKYHPDKKGGDVGKFKEVSEAYSILSDDKKRAEYDSYGRVFNGAPGPGAGGFDFSGFQGFEDFNFGDIFSEFFGGGRRGQGRRGRDISIDLELSFAESVFGTVRKVLLTKASPCVTCSGSGAKPGTELKTCATCNGKGKIHETRESFFGSVSTVRACEICHGSGKIPKEKCAVCHGAGVTRGEEEIPITIPAGIEAGEMIRLSGMGEAITGGAPGDLYVKIHIKKHPLFRKEGHHLVMDLSIKLSDALLGAEYPIETLDGKIAVKIPEGVSPGEILRVKGKGVPFEKGKRGDLMIRVAISMPSKLSRKAKDLVEDLKKEGI